MEIVVTGMGGVSALGTLEQTWKRLLAGETGIHSQQPFSELPAQPLALIHSTPASVELLVTQVVQAALQDANLPNGLPDCGVVVGSSRGNQARWEQVARRCQGRDWQVPELAHWLDMLPHAAAIATARHIQTTAPVLAPMAACATGLWAIAQGCELLHSGACQQVIAGAVEAPITPLTLTGFARMGALARTGAYPFDRDREGMVLGEGGAVLVLETAAAAKRRSAQVYGRILGYGLTADGYHVSAPDVAGEAAISAIRQCLQRAGLAATAIDFIHAHGTATQLNDRNEARLIQALFADGVAVSSTKGATGHTIGASGALGVAFCLLAMRNHLLPPCTGLKQPDFELNFMTQTTPALVEHTLCLSFGFGGQNAAIALGPP